MITLTFDLTTGQAKLSTSTTIKLGSQQPVTVVFSAAPNNLGGIQLALGDDNDAPDLLAYTETFAQVNDTTWTAVLDCTDSRLIAYMTGKGPTALNLELAPTLDGDFQPAPNVSVTVQPAIIGSSPTSEGGPSYYTEAQVNTLLATYALLTVAAKYRVKSDGSFQLWNATQSLWQTIGVTGAAGAEALTIGAGES